MRDILYLIKLKLLKKLKFTESPYDTFKYLIYNRAVFYANACGSNIADPTYKYSLRTYIFVASTVLFTLFSAYTIYSLEDTHDKIKCLITLPFGFQGLIKQYSFLHDPPQMRNIVLFLEGIYVASLSNVSNRMIFLNTTKLAKVIVTFMEVIYLSTILLYLVNPIAAFITKGQFELLLYVFIPGADPKQPIGYMANLCFQAMMMFFGIAGTCCSDIYCFSMVIHLRPLQQIFQKNIRELNEMLVKSPYSETALVKMQLRNTLLLHKDIYSFTDKVKKGFSATCFGEVYGNALGIIACIYSILTDDYSNAYSMLLMLQAKLLIYCCFGTLFEHYNEEIYKDIQRISWYLLPVKDQKPMIMMLASAQRPHNIMAGVVPSNLNTFVKVMQNIYSITMLLIETL